ncbi:MAG: class I poly(R)-hydroxyalkanoic acid synthase [Betaproteobacteria bacterium]|nr:class I poly(R)-hydroxyalkanoic acid synthase [Betaproteobacteria bacterium]
MPASAGSPEALVASIAGAGEQPGAGWMNLGTGVPPEANPAAWLASMAPDPARLAELQASYVEKQTKLWAGLLGQRPAEPAVAPEPGDRRFAAKDWRESAYYDYIRQSYLLAARFFGELAENAQLEARAKERLRFAVKQWLDASSPANFLVSNPEALRAALETRGESLTRGLGNLLADAHKGRISQSDESAFEVGRNLALTAGHVVHENELMQLIQYAPATPQVAERPLVMVPPCINKYYILDLQPENSFVRYAVEQGHTVFMVSWRNVAPAQGHYGWDDYLEMGVFEPLRVARDIARSDRVNALGFCVGGTLLGAALAVLAAKGEALVASVTYLTTMLDFAEPGPLGVFIDEASLAAREASIGRGGILPGSDLYFVFAALRANDLVWPYVVNSYLKGRSPDAFDLLYWNADSTNLPGPMYCYYVRNTYLENKLRVPGALVNCGVPVDLGKVGLPSFILATREDHIVPWRAAYRSVHLLGGEKRFVLGASGHVAGVINPAAKKRRSYWTGGPYPEDPEAWLAQAEEHPGSWWPRWADWLAAFKGGVRNAPAQPGNGTYCAREPAPGRYVGQRAPAVHAGQALVERGTF